MRQLLKHLRKEKGSQAKVASELGISRQFLGLIESGDRNPTVKLMAKMERYFDTPAKDLFPDLFVVDKCHDSYQDDDSQTDCSRKEQSA